MKFITIIPIEINLLIEFEYSEEDGMQTINLLEAKIENGKMFSQNINILKDIPEENMKYILENCEEIIARGT